MLIALLSGLLLILIVITLGATAIHRSGWWNRKRRACLRRIEIKAHRGEKAPFTDQAFNHICLLVEALSFEMSDNPVVHDRQAKRQVILKPDRRLSEIPLRFQPEKFYGTTSTMCSQRTRERSASSLVLPDVFNSLRRSSMIETLHSWRTPTPVLNFEKEAKQDGVNMCTTNLPQIDITCEGDEPQCSRSRESYENVQSDVPEDSKNTLSVILPIRRASATNFELTAMKLPEKFSDNSERPNSDIECGTNVPDSDQPKYMPTKRRSLWDTFSPNSPFKKIDVSMKNRSKMRPSLEQFQLPLQTKTESGISLPAFVPGGVIKSGGAIALFIKLDYETSESGLSFEVNLVAAKGLKPYHPWKKHSYNFKFICRYAGQVQHSVITCKDAELGYVRFEPNRKLRFGKFPVSNPGQDQTGRLEIQVSEQCSHWSVGREYLHGFAIVDLNDQSLHQTLWHLISPGIPVIRIKADLLVSLCYRQAEGVLIVGVQQIRNLKFIPTSDRVYLDLDKMVCRSNLELNLRVCLIIDNHLVKSRKFRFHRKLENSQRKNGVPHTETAQCAQLLQTTNFDQWTSTEQGVQFMLDGLRKHLSKQTLRNIGILLFVQHKASTESWLPAEERQVFKDLGLQPEKFSAFVGECFIGDQTTQTDYHRENDFVVKTDCASATLWNEAIARGGSRVYQWLSVE